jgi:hypothetical protein
MMCPEPMLNCSVPLRADRAQNPPTSSLLADKRRAGLLLLSTRRAIRATAYSTGKGVGDDPY